MKTHICYVLSILCLTSIFAVKPANAYAGSEPLLSVQTGTKITLAEPATFERGMTIFQDGKLMFAQMPTGRRWNMPADFNYKLPKCSIVLGQPLTVDSELVIESVTVVPYNEIRIKTPKFDMYCVSKSIESDPSSFLVSDFNEVVSALLSL